MKTLEPTTMPVSPYSALGLASAPHLVLYAADLSNATHGTWQTVQDTTAAAGVRLNTADAGWSATATPLAAPADYVDVTFQADANTSYAIWLRLKALNNSKYNDAVWVQFSDAQANGAAARAD